VAIRISVIIDFPAVTASEPKYYLSVSIPRQPPLQSAKINELVRSSLEVVLAVATVLSAQFGYSVFKPDRFAREMEPPKLLPQCLYIAAWNIERRKVSVLVASVGKEPVCVGPSDWVLVSVIELVDFLRVVMTVIRLPFYVCPRSHQLRRDSRRSSGLPRCVRWRYD
jgi:hypothetical protein